MTAFTAFLQSLEPDAAPRVLLFYGARTPELFIYGPLAEACARPGAVARCRLVAEASAGVLDVEPRPGRSSRRSTRHSST